MRRTKLVLAVGATMVAMLVAFAAPAMADDRHNHHDRFFSQDSEQEADSGDINQSFDVTGGGDNSNQTVGIQGVANTGNAQNQIDLSDGFGRDDSFCDHRFCNNSDFCDDFDFDGFCDRDRGFFFRDFNGDGFDDDFEFEDVGATIDLSPEQVTTSDQQVNQAASASG
jgi:hypothetical protein